MVRRRPEGRERIRAAHLRHGFYAQAEEVALRALGEDPAQFQELLERLWEKWNPTDALQEKLVARLARAVWRLDRSDRMQEGYALRQAKDVSIGREDRLHAQMMRLKMTSASLQSLAQSVACEHYVTTPADLELMKNLHQEGVVKEMGEIALALFYQLQAPGAPGEQDEGGGRSDPEANVRKVVARIQEIFGVRTSDPEPEADVAPASPARSRTDRPGRAAGHREASKMLALPRRRRRGRLPASPRRNGRRGSRCASFLSISSRGRWRFARLSARPPCGSP